MAVQSRKYNQAMTPAESYERADYWASNAENLFLIECWARDGMTLEEIARRIGVTSSIFRNRFRKDERIRQAIRRGKEYVDYEVENALLKCALGFDTKETRIMTTIKNGKTIETVKETTNKEVAPNVTAIQVWLYNRCRDKWKKNWDNMLQFDEENSEIHVTVTRAGAGDGTQAETQNIEMRKSTPEEKAKVEAQNKKKRQAAKEELEDLDAWPDDWHDE